MKKALISAGVLIAVALGVFVFRAAMIHELRKPILAQLSDPDSAQFRSEVLYSGWTLGNSALCGEVNAKNRLGGYVGFAPYDVIADIAHVVDPFEVDFKKKANLPLCPFEGANAPWWHLRW